MATASFSELMKIAGDDGFSPCPPGQYDVKVATAEPSKTAKGKTMFILKYEIVGGLLTGRKVTNRITISPESAPALNFFFRDMRAMGLGPEFFGADPSPAQVASALVGRTCRIEVVTETYNGEERDAVKRVLPPPAALAAPAVPGPAPTAVVPAPVPAELLQSADPSAPPLPY